MNNFRLPRLTGEITFSGDGSHKWCFIEKLLWKIPQNYYRSATLLDKDTTAASLYVLLMNILEVINAAGICLLKVNNRNTRARCEICFTPCSTISIVNFERLITGFDAWNLLEVSKKVQQNRVCCVHSCR